MHFRCYFQAPQTTVLNKISSLNYLCKCPAPYATAYLKGTEPALAPFSLSCENSNDPGDLKIHFNIYNNLPITSLTDI